MAGFAFYLSIPCITEPTPQIAGREPDKDLPSSQPKTFSLNRKKNLVDISCHLLFLSNHNYLPCERVRKRFLLYKVRNIWKEEGKELLYSHKRVMLKIMIVVICSKPFDVIPNFKQIKLPLHLIDRIKSFCCNI